MLLNTKFWKNKKVLITGCTGFSGSWLIIFLNILRSRVIGYSLSPPSKPNLFNVLGLKNNIRLHNGDINNYNNLKKIIYKEKPDIIFHLAANAIVLDCHRNPIKTYKTNSYTTKICGYISHIKLDVYIYIYICIYIYIYMYI